jgi:hypothetical protein
MRLLNTDTWEMTEFISHDQIPPYAILSHTWESQEVTYQDWESREASGIEHLAGFRKIKGFGENAALCGYQWVWVDT